MNRLIPGITEKMLSMQLRELEKDGLVVRTVYAEVPPRVEYALSAEGRTLLPLLEELAKWGRRMGGKYGTVEEVKVSRPNGKRVKA